MQPSCRQGIALISGGTRRLLDEAPVAVVAWLVDSRLPGMPDLPARLATILDERDRRAGRSGEQSWRAMS